MKMLTSITAVNECDGCLNFRGYNEAPKCKAMDITLGGRCLDGPDLNADVTFPIPDWCPLPDYPVAAKEAKPMTPENKRIAELEAALRSADAFLTILQTPGSEPLNSINGGDKATRSRLTAELRNQAREVWAIVGNTLNAESIANAEEVSE
jgi:hypothetical protein